MRKQTTLLLSNFFNTFLSRVKMEDVMGWLAIVTACFKENIHFTFMFGSLACMYVWVPRVSRVSMKVRRGHQISELKLQMVMSCHVEARIKLAASTRIANIHSC